MSTKKPVSPGRDGDDLDARRDDNRDPLSGEKGAHPVGTGIGAAAAGAAGMAIGAVAGPIGAGIGAAIGAVAGGLMGKGAAEAIDPTAEDAYWQKTYTTRPYYDRSTAYDSYRPAYQYGWESGQKHQGKGWNDVEGTLRQDWESGKQKTAMGWDKAKDAVRDAWDRVSGPRSAAGMQSGSMQSGGMQGGNADAGRDAGSSGRRDSGRTM